MMKDLNGKIPSQLNHTFISGDDVAINQVHEQYLLLQQHYGTKTEDGKAHFTPYERCLHRLVEILPWSGDQRHLMEALPHLESLDDIHSLQAVLLRIGQMTKRRHVRYLKYAKNIFPCILDFKQGPILLTEDLGKGVYKGFDEEGKECEFKWSQLKKADALYLIQAEEDLLGVETVASGSWFKAALKKMRRPIVATLFLTFIANILTLATPIYTMNVYNKVIGSQALDTLGYFFVGILIAVCAEILIRRERGRIIAFIGARIDAEITNHVFKQILTLPLQMTESASVNKQIVQFRQFESIRDLLTGNLASTLLDLPFLFIFFGVIAYLSGWLALIPFVLLFIFGVVSMLSLPVVRQRGRKSGHDRAQFNRMSMELANKMQAIRELGAEELWLARHNRVSTVSAHSMFLSRFFETSLQSGAQILVMLAGLATISIGAYFVIDGTMNTGALIAIMMIVWRILTPIQIAFLSLNRIGQLRQTVRQLDRLMTIKRERRFKGRPNSLRKFEGNVKFENVSFRYGPRSEPALKGVSFEIKHGEVIAVTGATGCGKSTILKMMLGLYKPQAGRIFLDNINIQQLDVGEVRSSMGYMPQDISMFYGSLAQNMILGNPTANRDEILSALEKAGIMNDGPLLENGLDQAIRVEKSELSESDLASIALARSYLIDGPFLLLDNPGVYLDHDADKHFIKQLDQFRGRRTVILVTNRPSHIKACDRILQFHAGALVNDVPVEAYIEAMKNAQSTG